MARMIGKTLRILQCPYECCGDTRDRASAKQQEKSAWIREAEQEMNEEDQPDHSAPEWLVPEAASLRVEPERTRRMP